MTQEQLSQLLGVHSLTISKWERGVLTPTAYQKALLETFLEAAQRDPGIGESVIKLLALSGVPVALFIILRSAFSGGFTH